MTRVTLENRLNLGCFALLLLGGLALGGRLLQPAFRGLAARGWPAVPCTVTSSGAVPSKGGGVYRPEVRFTYRFAGRPFEGRRYDFSDAFSGGHAENAALAGRYPAGKRATCYVNPANPEEAVLRRDTRPATLRALLVPLLFVLVGAVGLVTTLLSGRPFQLRPGAADPEAG